MADGVDKEDRTGTGTRSVFGYQMRFDLSRGFPLLTTKKVFLRGIIHELLWFLAGSSNIKYLVDNDVHIWDAWPYKYYRMETEKKGETPLEQTDFIAKVKEDAEFARVWGELGPVYGVQWRHWKTGNNTPRPSATPLERGIEAPSDASILNPSSGGEIDQITQLVELLKNDPNSRRLIVSAWNVADIESMTKSGLPPCHCLFQFYVANGKLSCQLYQRSADIFLGVPFNIASYSLLTMMIAQVTGLGVGDFVHTFGDAHIYNNHFDQVNEQLSREIRGLPTMKINPEVKDIFGFTFEDFTLEGYDPHPTIKAPIAV